MAQRARFKQDRQAWFQAHTLTAFGKSLTDRPLRDHYIVTTKDRRSTEDLLEHFRIAPAGVYALDDFNAKGSKGVLLWEIMDQLGYAQAWFIDDSISHLETVEDDRVRCLLASWGYLEPGGTAPEKGHIEVIDLNWIRGEYA